ncbi:thiamine pyrophosphokinase [Elsinoe ampelina]|uniref:Thiamine pyrophosphokinase n=1 Tax=Elsinoe ampelina TaxID=302913 RepID=A0A6A6G5M3_9PEZI|nr:thiamine pyrophosphokinase [Elsinoe ampelina]
MAEQSRGILRPLDFLRSASVSIEGPTEKHAGLVVLNSPISHADLVKQIWPNTSYRVCADGGANRVYSILSSQQKSLLETYLPTEIHGDLDSLRDDVRAYYERHNVPVTKDGDQYHTDFEKSIGRVIASVPSLTNIIVLGSLSGRVDQGIGLLSELYRQQRQHPNITIWLFSESSISFILPKGKTTIAVPVREGRITENAGILPVFGPATITIEGFEWDVVDWPTELGGQVSTSNHIKADEVSVETDREVLFTIERSGPES